MSSFPTRLRKARLAVKMTQENLASALGISKTQISAWESGKERPSSKHFVNLRRILKVSIDWLLIGPSAALSFDSIADSSNDLTIYQTGSMDLAVRMLQQMSDEERQLIIELIFRMTVRQQN